MMYPTISEYIEAIKYAEDNFATLTDLRPVLDGDGNPVMSSGNFAVVFKMQDTKTNKLYALKCFTREQEGRAECYRLISDELEYVSSDCMVKVKYLDKELFVDTQSSDETEFPVVLMDWVEGTTLDKWIGRNIGSQYSLQLITHQFCRMASWLLSQPFAHGDLKPDNIIVTESGSIVLVDYDGMYVPAMQGQKSRELGSPDYRHPSRTLDDFNEHIDDFSLAVIALQLAAIALDPTLYSNHDGDTLLLSEQDHRDIANSDTHRQLLSLLHNPDFERLYALYHLAHAQQTLTNVDPRTFTYPKPDKLAVVLSTKVTKEDLANGVKDEYGALYSPDGLRLLEPPLIFWGPYQIRQGTRVICNSVFLRTSIASITIPDSVTHIGTNPFAESNITKIECESPHFVADNYALYTKGKQALIAFINKKVWHFTIPDTVSHIGDRAFEDCESLSSITIPASVAHIGDCAFEGCSSLTSITIPASVAHIGDSAFSCCKSLTTITIPASVTHIGDSAFLWCNSLTSISIPVSVTHIGDRAFEGCKSLTSIYIPDSVTHIGDRAFEECFSLNSITIPISVTHIGTNPFVRSGISTIDCESPYFEADNYALYTKGKQALIAFINEKVSHFNIPESVTYIGDRAFEGCSSLTSITIPASVTYIGDFVFSFTFFDCESLTSIFIPRGSKEKFKKLLPFELYDKLVEQ